MQDLTPCRLKFQLLRPIPDPLSAVVLCCALNRGVPMLRVWMSVGLLLLSGCASVLHGDAQQLKVTVLCKDRVVPAACVAQNTKGVWHFQAPAVFELRKDFSHLQIACKAPFFSEITATVPSRLNLSTAGNLLVGGVVGAGVDAYRGAAFAYNPDVRLSIAACR
jgi:hypothetical protein